MAASARVWNVDGAPSAMAKVILVRNGSETVSEFSGDTPLADGVMKVARDARLTAIVVKDASGNVINDDEGGNLLSDYGTVKVYPKAQGASN
jgi:hypothetical protein